jgi:hypothetical protein
MIWFSRLSAISQLASRLGEGGGELDKILSCSRRGAGRRVALGFFLPYTGISLCGHSRNSHMLVEKAHPTVVLWIGDVYPGSSFLSIWYRYRFPDPGSNSHKREEENNQLFKHFFGATDVTKFKNSYFCTDTETNVSFDEEL